MGVMGRMGGGQRIPVVDSIAVSDVHVQNVFTSTVLLVRQTDPVIPRT